MTPANDNLILLRRLANVIEAIEAPEGTFVLIGGFPLADIVLRGHDIVGVDVWAIWTVLPGGEWAMAATDPRHAWHDAAGVPLCATVCPWTHRFMTIGEEAGSAASDPL